MFTDESRALAHLKALNRANNLRFGEGSMNFSHCTGDLKTLNNYVEFGLEDLQWFVVDSEHKPVAVFSHPNDALKYANPKAKAVKFSDSEDGQRLYDAMPKTYVLEAIDIDLPSKVLLAHEVNAVESLLWLLTSVMPMLRAGRLDRAEANLNSIEVYMKPLMKTFKTIEVKVDRGRPGSKSKVKAKVKAITEERQ
jgi:hypothetical protein